MSEIRHRTQLFNAFKNLSLTASSEYSRNTGLELAQGEYVAFVDGDDWIEPDMLENMLGKLIENNADIAKCGFVFRSVNSHRSRVLFNEVLFLSHSLPLVVP